MPDLFCQGPFKRYKGIVNYANHFLPDLIPVKLKYFNLV